MAWIESHQELARDSFVLYTAYRAQIERLTIEQRGILLTAIFSHVGNAEMPDMDAATDMAFSFIAAQIDRDNSKWQNTRQKRAESGRKGGIASGDSRKQNEANEANEAVYVDGYVDVSGNKEYGADAPALADEKQNRINGRASATVDVLPKGFDLFWQTYPKRVKKADAIRAWGQVKASDCVDVILSSLDLFIRSPEWEKNDGQFVPYPASWLRARRWEDDTAPASTRNPNPYFALLEGGRA